MIGNNSTQCYRFVIFFFKYFVCVVSSPPNCMFVFKTFSKENQSQTKPKKKERTFFYENITYER